ncbi:hypothetical protein RIF29_25562 [Crotalaria pallida]|uniref:non-specific serine/threonine protein kinase n=1 Tax=Crotalaria pallida TaxID=3830 RepID=A0AAN9ERS2_CROPI
MKIEESKSVVVIQDASKELCSKVFSWAIDGLSLKAEDEVTLVAILHQVYTPMGYISTVDSTSMVGTNARIIEEQAAMRKEEYLRNEELAEIAKLYESNEVAFKIQLVTGSSTKDVAVKAAINLKASWLILDRQMKKDEEFFLRMLSCGISRLMRNNRIVHLRGPLEIQCNSHVPSDESLQENTCEDLFSINVFSKREIKVDELSQLQSRNLEDERNTVLVINNDGINSNQVIGEIKRVQQCKEDQEQIQSMSHEEERNTEYVINNDQTTAHEIAEADQPSRHEEKIRHFFHDEDSGLRHPTNSEEMIDQTKDDLLGQNQAQTQSTSHGDIFDGQKNKSILENSICICSVCKTRRPNINLRKEFTYEELQAATDGFSLKNCLSESGNLSTFRGQLECGMKIVVKLNQKEIKNSTIREKIMPDVQTILEVRHKNVIMLLGSSTEKGFLLTVYEHACNGSLDKHLSKESSRTLTWRERVKVAIGLSRGLKYLHENNIIHGNIKPSNILLTHDFNPLLGDFGLGKRFELKKSYKSESIGNSEYIAPEYQERGKLSNKMDVYSFGMVLLELITGRRATDKISGAKSLAGWAKPLLGGKKYAQLLDPIMSNSCEEDQLHWLAKVIEQCLKKNPKERSSMNMVVSALQGIADSEECCMAKDFTPASAISCSSFVPDMNGLEGPSPTEAGQPSQEQKQIENSSNGEERRRLKLTVENNHFYVICQSNTDQMSQAEEQMQSETRAGERSSGNMIKNDHMIDQTVVDQMSEFEEQMNSTLTGDGISTQNKSVNHMIGQTKFHQLSRDPETISRMTDQIKEDQLIQDKTQLQNSWHENLEDGHQGEVISRNPKCFSCSICKIKRPNIAWKEDYPYDELLDATEGFSIENCISESEDGPTFKGQLESKLKIVVKKYQISMSQEENIYKSKVQSLSEVKHKNIIMLLGLCIYKSQMMIVYEQACNGSLDQYLSRGSFKSLTWRERMKVALGTARGLKYLHENNIIHGNIKSSNILLTHDFEPQIGDFGIGKAKLESKKAYKDKNATNSGYTAPECLESGMLSNKTDTYSFGAVLLELITGRSVTDKLTGSKSLVAWARPLLRGKKYAQLVDPKIINSYDEEQLAWLVQVTEQCLRKNPKERYTMNMVSLGAVEYINPKVVSALQGIADSDECCAIQDFSPEKLYLAHGELSTTISQGQIKADPLIQEQEWTESNTCGEDRSIVLADHLRQDEKKMQSSPHGEEICGVSVINNHMIDQQGQEQDHTKESLHIEGIGEMEVDKQQSVHENKKQMQCSTNEDLLNGNEREIICKNLISSTCSICKSRRPCNGWKRKFTYEELQAATDGFSVKNSLSEGEYGLAFRGQLDCKLKIVVKRHQITSLQEEKVFMSEIQMLTDARHENVIMLLGSCKRESQLLIVYEHACNGSLDQYLSSKDKSVGDFAIEKERCDLKNGCNYKNMGNCGYTAPECQKSGRISTETDVYSFGVVLLDLVTGSMITDKISGTKCPIEWARSLLVGGKYLLLVDPKISSSCNEQELLSLVQVIEKCLRKNPKERLTMNMVFSALQCLVDSNDNNATEESSSEKLYAVCSVSDVTSSKGDEESPVEEDLSTVVSEEREDNITCSRSNADNYASCGGSLKETQEEKESTKAL